MSGFHYVPASRGLQVLVLAVLLAFLLAACGESSPPWGYVWTDAAHLEMLSWNAYNSQLSGQYSSISYAPVHVPPTAQPDIYGGAYKGTLNGQTVNITIGTGLLSEHLTGMLSGDGTALTLSVLDPTSGKAVQQKWVAVNGTQQRQLVSAFNVYQTARTWLAVVQQEEQRENGWHDPNASTITTTQAALQKQQAQVEAMQQAPDGQTRCTLIAAYRPLDSSWFALPFPASGDGLLSAMSHFRQAWQQAERSSIPRLTGLALPWLLSSAGERQAIAAPSMLASRIQTAYQADEQAIQQDQQRSRQLDGQVTHLSQGCPPMPA